MSPDDEMRLVRAYGESHSEAAFRELFRSFSAAPYRVALRMLNDRRDAEDALHDAWIRACEGIAGFRRESSFSSWLVGICVNRCREMLRTRVAGPDPAPAAVVQPVVERLDLARAVAQLPSGYRTVLLLHDVEGHTHDEIGKFLGIDPGTSKSQLFHARRVVRALLSGREREHEVG